MEVLSSIRSMLSLSNKSRMRAIGSGFAILALSMLAISMMSFAGAASTTDDTVLDEEIEIEEGEYLETELAFEDNATVEVEVTDLDAEEPEIINSTTVTDDNANVTEIFDISAGNYSVSISGLEGAYTDVTADISAEEEGLFGVPGDDDDSWLSSPLGLLSTIGAGVAGYLAVVRGYAGAAVSRVSGVFK